MAYEKQNFKNGQKLTAQQLNHIEEGLYEAASKADALEEAVGNSQLNLSGNVLRFESDLSTDVTVKSESGSADSVTLVHAGKNLAPFHATGTPPLEYVNNPDGSVHVTGTTTEVAFVDICPFNAPLYIPKGTYTLSCNIDSDLGYNVIVYLEAVDKSSIFSVNGINTVRSYTFEQDKNYLLYIYVKPNVTIDHDIWFQLEVGVNATEHEPHKATRYTGALPRTFKAYSGVNTVYTETGDVLQATVRTSVADTIKAALDGISKMDYSAYSLPVLSFNGATGGMTKDNAVDLAYTYGDLNGTASVKWQGSSSLSYPKKNYTVKFDQAFEAAPGWGAQRKYCLKANYIDFSHCRNVVSAKLWGQIIASRSNADAILAACPNYGAIDGFPIIVMLNGEYQGVYTFNIPKDGWMLNMGAGSKECILCADAHSESNRFKAPATLDGDFDVEYITDENDTSWALTSVNNLINACIASDGTDLDTTIAAMLDWDSAIDYYIFATLLRGEDIVTKNYLLYTHDGTKWKFGAYDLDSTYGLHYSGTSYLPALGGLLYGYSNLHRVFELIYTYKKDALKARYQQIRNHVMSEDNIALSFRNFSGLIPRPLLDEDNRKWTTIPNTNTNNVQQILDWYRLRCQYLDAEVAGW